MLTLGNKIKAMIDIASTGTTGVINSGILPHITNWIVMAKYNREVILNEGVIPNDPSKIVGCIYSDSYILKIPPRNRTFTCMEEALAYTYIDLSIRCKHLYNS